MMRYDKIHKDWVDLDTWYARRNGAPQDQVGIYVQPDLQPFKSPLEGHKVIDGRRALREELARNNCRLVEKGEGAKGWNGPVYKNPSFALKRGLPLNGEKR